MLKLLCSQRYSDTSGSILLPLTHELFHIHLIQKFMSIFYPGIVYSYYLYVGENAGMTWWPADLDEKHGTSHS